jgi:hypothetical protein
MVSDRFEIGKGIGLCRNGIEIEEYYELSLAILHSNYCQR